MVTKINGDLMQSSEIETKQNNFMQGADADSHINGDMSKDLGELSQSTLAASTAKIASAQCNNSDDGDDKGSSTAQESASNVLFHPPAAHGKDSEDS